jgi:hypothetical protein
MPTIKTLINQLFMEKGQAEAPKAAKFFRYRRGTRQETRQNFDRTIEEWKRKGPNSVGPLAYLAL